MQALVALVGLFFVIVVIALTTGTQKGKEIMIENDFTGRFRHL